MSEPIISAVETVLDNGSFGKRTVKFETGLLARQAAGSVTAYLDDETMLLSATTAGKHPKDHFDFFPLTIDVEERMYAAGQIPGSFFRSEGRPGEDAILTCRLIDRPLRPTFKKGLRNEVQVVITVMALDPDHPYDVLAINAASLSTQLSGLPFSGPVGGVRVALIDGQWVAFPTHSQLEDAVFDMVVAGRVTESGDVAIMMVEATGHDLLGRRLGAALHECDGVLGRLGLDHHDRDVAGLGHATGDDHVEDGRLELLVGRERHPPALDEGHADATDGAREGQAGELGGQRRGVDGQHVVGHVGVEGHHGDDDLDLVAQALLERRAQRAVDQAAGEDRVLARTSLGPEERAGDLAHGVHPLLDVDRQGEEVEVVLGRLAGGGRRQEHGVVVEVGRDGAGRLAGEQAGLELDRALAEGAVVEDGLDSGDDGFTHGSRICFLFAERSATPHEVPVFDRGPQGCTHLKRGT